MGIFKNKKEGGLMDVIRCDEKDYLIWKWRPDVDEAENLSKKENAIRYGSSLRVKDGEVAVFVYTQKDGKMQDFIEGPFDDTIKTANFPVLSSIVGLAFGGSSPFQAEIYFINLAKINQVQFGVPYFDVADPRFLDFAVPVAVRGVINFKITDYKEFIKLHRLVEFNLQDFQAQIHSAVRRYVKELVTNIPSEKGIPVIQLERKIREINEGVNQLVKPRLQNDFGVSVTEVDISEIEIDKQSDGYQKLMSVTQNVTTQTSLAQAAVNIKQMQDMQRVQIEEMQRAQRLQTESANISAHQLDQQAAVGIAGAEAFGKMGANGGGQINVSGNGFSPAGMMVGMTLGSAIGQNMAGMMRGILGGEANQMAQGKFGSIPIPPVPSIYNVAVNGQSTGPYTVTALAQMVASGQITKESLVWKKGMKDWQSAGTLAELSALFGTNVPPIPPVPPVPPSN